MKDLKKFNHTVNVLLKAYLNDTLQHSNCHACAVGNIIAEAIGVQIVKDPTLKLRWASDYPIWYDPICFGYANSSHKNIVSAKLQCEAAGYTIQQAAKIERAFESSTGGNHDDEFDDTWMFNGLMAVVDVLAEIHEIDLDTVKETKELFV